VEYSKNNPERDVHMHGIFGRESGYDHNRLSDPSKSLGKGK
jgi:hypothetical protein